MPRYIDEKKFEEIVSGKKIDRQATKEAWEHEEDFPEAIKDHPLIVQNKAIQSVAEHLVDQGRAMDSAVREIVQALKNHGGESAVVAKTLTELIDQNNALIRQMMITIRSLHVDKKEKSRKITINVNRASDGYIESMDLTVEGQG